MSDKEILRYQRELDDLFDKVSSLNSDPEMQSHWAKYLCIRVSGFLEVAVSTIYKKYAKEKAHPSRRGTAGGRAARIENDPD